MESSATKSFIGLSLYPDQVCLVEMEGRRVRAIAARELVQPFDLKTLRVGEGSLDSVVQVVRDLYERMHGTSREVGIVLNDRMVLVKKIPVALGLTEEMLKEQMAWETEQILVASRSDYAVEYDPLPFKTATGNPEHLMILVRRKILKMVHSLVKRVGMTLRVVDVDVFSSIRALVANYDITPEETAVLVDVQRGHITCSVLRQQDYFLSHRVSLQEEATIPGSLDASETAKVVVKELRRLVFGHRLGREIEDLDRIFLAGSETVQEIYQELSSAVSVPLEMVNPFRQLEVSPSVSQSTEFVKSPERCVAAVGVALKTMPSPLVA